MLDSTLISLGDIIDNRYRFNIPIYQRLYVWKAEQVRILLADIWEACQEERDVFYLGTVIVIKKGTGVNMPMFDLIDGQQRFTTLWLISLVWKRGLADFASMGPGASKARRIEFEIREDVQKFFNEELSGEHIDLDEANGLKDALAEIKSFANQGKVDSSPVCLDRLTQFIRDNVRLVFTQVPASTDLNKLFELINNRGQQLQHHEILKARLLAILPKAERDVYGALWDACAQMGNYVERNLAKNAGLSTARLYQPAAAKQDQEDLRYPKKVLNELKELVANEANTEMTLAQILGKPVARLERKKSKDDKAEPDERVRSIVSFSMLLQHVLRIFLVNKSREDIAKVLDRDLIKIFNESWLASPSSKEKSKTIVAQEVRAFIELLWEIRYLFDKHVIKWVIDDDEEVHAIRPMQLKTTPPNGKSLARGSMNEVDEFALLQSMLYHSQQITTHYWLTPLLMFLLDHGSRHAPNFLQHLDNHLLCAKAGGTLLERSREFLQDPWHQSELVDVTEALSEKTGTDFPHYWFYKMEFVLWHCLHKEKGPRWSSFRMTARNSVEHVAPQTPLGSEDAIPDDYLHSFGNLCLVSRSLNSEMGNSTFSLKKAKYDERNQTKASSLKMDMIYSKRKWTVKEIKGHHDEMVSLLEAYMNLGHKTRRA